MKISKLCIGLAAFVAVVSCSSPVVVPDPTGTTAIELIAGSHFTVATAGDSAPAADTGYTRYEAEDTSVATPFGQYGADAQSFHSGGNAVGGFYDTPVASTIPSDWSTGLSYVKFALSGLTAGNYTVRLGYNGPEAKTILVRKDDASTAVQISIPASDINDWAAQQYIDLTVPFDAGTDNLWISQPVREASDTTRPWYNIDYIDIKKQ